jgi:hypothetical protein
MSEDSEVLSGKSRKCGDEYVRAKTLWIIGGRNRESVDKQYALATLYDHALDQLLTDLRLLLPTKIVREQISLALLDKSLLAKDLKLFAVR